MAARMEQIAVADSTYLSEHTGKLASGHFQLRDLGETRIKGLSDPLRVFELQGVGRVRTRLDVSNARGFTKFVGRQSEMAVSRSPPSWRNRFKHASYAIGRTHSGVSLGGSESRALMGF